MSRFDDCLRFVLQWEGGYVDDPDDPGGATNHGVTQGTYSAWLRRHGQPDRSVETIPPSDVAAIYHADYWLPVAQSLGAPDDLAAFDTAVNCGVKRTLEWMATCYLRRPAVGLKPCLLARRRAHYAGLIQRQPAMAKFARGWERRVAALELAQ